MCGRYITWFKILHGIEYQRPTSLNMRILADHVTYSFLAFMKSIFHFCLGCYCGGYSQNGRSNLSSCLYWRWMSSSAKKVASRFSLSLRNSIDNNKCYDCKCTFIIFQQDMAHKGLTIPMWIQNIQCLSLTYWGRVTHICVGKLSIIGSDNGLSPDRRQTIIWTNAGILLIGTLGTNSMKF